MACYRQWKWVWNQQCHVSSGAFLIPVWIVLLSIFTRVNGRLLWFPTALKTIADAECLHLFLVQKRWQSKVESPQPFYNSCSQPLSSSQSFLFRPPHIHTFELLSSYTPLPLCLAVKQLPQNTVAAVRRKQKSAHLLSSFTCSQLVQWIRSVTLK